MRKMLISLPDIREYGLSPVELYSLTITERILTLSTIKGMTNETPVRQINLDNITENCPKLEQIHWESGYDL